MNTILVALCVVWALIAGTTSAGKLNGDLYARYLCRGKGNGFRAPVPGSCSKYYECQNQVSQLEICPRFFDALSQKCVATDTGCLVLLSKELNAPAGCSGACCGIANGFALDPISSQIYYECKDNCVVATKECAANSMFSLQTLECTKSENCGGQLGTTSTTTKAPCTTTATTTTCTVIRTTTPCSTTTATTKKIAKPVTTTACSTTTTTCTTTTCGSAAAEEAATATTTGIPRTTEKATSQNDHQLSPNYDLYLRFVCRDKTDGSKLISLTSCTEFYVCNKGTAVLFSCGDQFFNPAKGICDLPENTACYHLPH